MTYPKPRRLFNLLSRGWSKVPDSKATIWALWGLALGATGFMASLALPAAVMAVLWLAALALGLLLVFRAEPLLSGAARSAPDDEKTLAPPPPEPPPPVAPPALLDMLPIAGGQFRMGSPPATEAQIQAYASDWRSSEGALRGWLKREQPAHAVQLSPFLMARTPVTRGQWRAVMSELPGEWEQDKSDDNLPATHVDWFQALAFCNALSRREGLISCYREEAEGHWQWDRYADGYRLPTEAEWEHACRAGTESRWFWGENPKRAKTHAWYRDNSRRRVQPVGKKTANPWKLHDMAGLVWEWCWDRFGTYPEDAEQPVADPTGPEEGDRRVIRGGSFENPPDFLRSAHRLDVQPDDRHVNLGLRCVRSRVRQP